MRTQFARGAARTAQRLAGQLHEKAIRLDDDEWKDPEPSPGTSILVPTAANIGTGDVLGME